MRIAVPVSDGKLCLHFGHSTQFAVMDVDASSQTVRSIEYMTPPAHEPGVLPRWLAEQRVELIIAGGMGRRARDLCSQHAIETLVGAPDESPEQLAIAYLKGELTSGANACDH